MVFHTAADEITLVDGSVIEYQSIFSMDEYGITFTIENGISTFTWSELKNEDRIRLSNGQYTSQPSEQNVESKTKISPLTKQHRLPIMLSNTLILIYGVLFLSVSILIYYFYGIFFGKYYYTSLQYLTALIFLANAYLIYWTFIDAQSFNDRLKTTRAAITDYKVNRFVNIRSSGIDRFFVNTFVHVTKIPYHTLDIMYTYHVDEKEYNNVSSMPENKNSIYSAKTFQSNNAARNYFKEQIAKSKTISIQYDPLHPGVSTLYVGGMSPEGSLVLIVACLNILFFPIFALGYWHKFRPKRETQASKQKNIFPTKLTK